MGNEFAKNINKESSKNSIGFLSKTFIYMPVITILVYFLTKNPFTSSLRLQFTLLSFIALLIYGYSLKKKGLRYIEDIKFRYLLTVVVLFLIASTGWFFSPFFFVLYLWAIFLAFIFTPAVSLSFVITLVILFSFNIGEVDLAYDFLVVLSLLTTIPLSLYLRREYLKLKEGKKDILILDDEKKEHQSKVEEILANKVNNLAVKLRQPINDVKMMAYQLGKGVKDRERMITASEEALRVIKEFEGEATGAAPLSTPTRLSGEPKSLLNPLPADRG